MELRGILTVLLKRRSLESVKTIESCCRTKILKKELTKLKYGLDVLETVNTQSALNQPGSLDPAARRNKGAGKKGSKCQIFTCECFQRVSRN